jgi:hypothetical protein
MESDVGKEYLPHQQRVIDEYKELKERRIKLNIFINSNEEFNKLSDNDKRLLSKQTQLMYELERVLQARISNF